MGEVPVDLDPVAEGHLSRGGGEGVAGGQQEGLGVPAAGVILGGELQYFQGGGGGCKKRSLRRNSRLYNKNKNYYHGKQ